MSHSKRAVGTLTVVVAAAVLSTGTALAGKGGGGKGGGGGDAGPRYTIVALDDGGGEFVGDPAAGANDINEAGHVVGTVADGASGALVAAFWEVDGTQSQITPLAGGSFAFGLNDSGEIVGSAAGQALYWSNPTAQPEPLPPLSPGMASVAYSINNAAVICGYASEPVFDEGGQPIGSTDVAVVWRVTYPEGHLQIAGPVALPTLEERSQAYAVSENDDASGQAHVVGAFMAANFVHTAAVRWTVTSQADGTLTVEPTPDLLEVGEAAAFGVNNLGVSCGEAPDVSPELDAFVWLGTDGLPLDPGGLPLTGALDVNDAGVIVGFGGEHTVARDALVWPSAADQPVVLNKFLPKRNSPFAFLKEATAVNEAGAIVGVGQNGVNQIPFLAQPK